MAEDLAADTVEDLVAHLGLTSVNMVGHYPSSEAPDAVAAAMRNGR